MKIGGCSQWHILLLLTKAYLERCDMICGWRRKTLKRNYVGSTWTPGGRFRVKPQKGSLDLESL